MESELEFGNMDLRMDYRKKPVRNTVAQQLMATINRSPLTQATMRPTARAAAPDQTLSVTVTIAGKVMTVGDRLPEKQKRKQADHVDGKAHDQKGNINIIGHGSNLILLYA